jgi:hypothetical protein
VKFHELPIPLLLFAIVKFNKEKKDIEIDKMMISYKIDDQFKPEILKYIELLIELSDEIKKTI